MSRKRKEPPPPGRFRPFEDIRLPEPEAPPESARRVPAAAEPPAPGDDDLFARSVTDVAPIDHGGDEPRLGSPRPPRLPDEDGEWRSFARDFVRGQARFDISWSDEFIEGHRHEVGQETMQRLRSGAIAWQEYRDLHGMTRLEARESVDRFIEASRRKGLRCVLIVHGRGKGSAGGLPVLKEKLVAWLTREGGMGAHVLAFCTARPCDGGYGAIYVLLR